MDAQVRALKTELEGVRNLAQDYEGRIKFLEAFTDSYQSILVDLCEFLDPMTRDKARDERRSVIHVIANEVSKLVQGQVDTFEIELNGRFSQLSYTVREHMVSSNEHVAKLKEALDKSKGKESSMQDKIASLDDYMDQLTDTFKILQSDVESKASYKELAQQEERFSDYTTLAEFEKIQSETSKKSSQRDFDILSDEVKWIKKCLSNYIHVDKEAELVKEMTSAIERKMSQYPTKTEFKNLRSVMFEHFSDIKQNTEQSFDLCQERDTLIKTELENLKDYLQRKPWTTDLKSIRKDMESTATIKDLELLRLDAMPGIAECFRKINDLTSEIQSFDRALGRLDEIICDKASKGDISIMKNSIRGFLEENRFDEKVKEFEEIFIQSKAQTSAIQNELPKLNLKIDALQLQLNSQKQETRDYKLVFSSLMELRDRVDSKADMADLVKIAERSALWSDTQSLKQQSDLLRRQVESSAILFASLSRTLLKNIDTPGVKYRRRAEVYRLLLSLLDWIKANKSVGVPEDLLEFEGNIDQTLKSSPTFRNTSRDIGFELLKPKSVEGNRLRLSTSSPRNRRDLPSIKTFNP